MNRKGLQQRDYSKSNLDIERKKIPKKSYKMNRFSWTVFYNYEGRNSTAAEVYVGSICRGLGIMRLVCWNVTTYKEMFGEYSSAR